MRDKDFAQRLNTACDGHDLIPAYGQGRQTWVKEQLGVSHEAVRKWFTGQTRPRPDKMRHLARVLEVDEAWLSLGIIPDTPQEEKRHRGLAVEGATYCVAGLIQLSGGNIAFPQDTDPRAGYVDLYAIVKGAQYSINVALAKHVTNGTYKFTIPKEYEMCRVIGVVQVAPHRLHLLNLEYDLIEKFKSKKGGYVEMSVHKTGSEYFIGDTKVPRILSFTGRW